MHAKQVPKRVQLCEVSPRDGFQAEKKWIPTEDKIKLINLLHQAGVMSMEVTSFVHPLAIPQLKDAEQVVAAVRNLPDLALRALVPNIRGAERAFLAGIKEIKCILSASDSHSLANTNCTVDQALARIQSIADYAEKKEIKVTGSISVAFGCPYEGEVSLRQIEHLVLGYTQLGIQEITLADTTGMANPRQVYNIFEELRDRFPDVIFSAHFHNTRGLAQANVLAALQQGITEFDSSIAGLGGCPYAPGASGNVATEDLTFMFHEMGIETGINLENLLQASGEMKKVVGHDGGSFLLQAGLPKKHQKPVGQIKEDESPG
jgi:Isopropylmalate/homocitrate/citramalate synthases